MARIYSRKKGKSGSTKPSKKVKPTWLKYKPKEIEFLVVKYAREGKTPSQIGMILRDTYGIVSVKDLCGKPITKIMEEKGVAPKLPEDLAALIRKSVLIKKHLESNKQDKTALRGLQLTESKINRLVRYYKRTKKLPLEWKFDPKKASLFIE